MSLPTVSRNTLGANHNWFHSKNSLRKSTCFRWLWMLTDPDARVFVGFLKSYHHPKSSLVLTFPTHFFKCGGLWCAAGFTKTWQPLRGSTRTPLIALTLPTMSSLSKKWIMLDVKSRHLKHI